MDDSTYSIYRQMLAHSTIQHTTETAMVLLGPNYMKQLAV